MTDFEKVQIGFDIAFAIIGIVGLFAIGNIEWNTDMCKFWLERDFKTKFSYTEYWKI